jgi:hypothetical protein
MPTADAGVPVRIHRVALRSLLPTCRLRQPAAGRTAAHRAIAADARAPGRARGACARARSAVLSALAVAGLHGATAAAQSPAPEPAVAWQSLLRFTALLGNAEPALRVVPIDVAFAPADDVEASVVVRRGDEIEATLPLRFDRRVGTMARYRFRTSFIRFEPVEGERVLEVRLGDAVAGRMRVTFRRKPGGDAFQPVAGWTVDGPWRDHGYFTRPADPSTQQRVRFTFWGSTLELGGAPKAMLEVVVRNGGRVVATSRPREVSHADWLRKDQDLRTPSGDVFLASHVAALRGEVTVELRTDGRVLKRFTTRAADGWFAPHADGGVPPADATHFLSPRTIAEGGGGLDPMLFAWVTP